MSFAAIAIIAAMQLGSKLIIWKGGRDTRSGSELKDRWVTTSDTSDTGLSLLLPLASSQIKEIGPEKSNFVA